MTMKVFNVGDVLAAADVNEYLVNTRYALKTADTSRTSTTTLTADPDLVVVADANKIYEMLIMMVYNGPTAGGFKFDVTVPSGTTFAGALWQVSSAGTFAAAAVLSPSGLTLAGITGFHFTATTGSDQAAYIMGTLDTAGTGGNVTVRWAQDTSSGTSTKLLTGSSARLRRVS